MSEPYRPPDQRWQKATENYKEALLNRDPQLVKKMAENENPPPLFSKVPGFEDSVARYRFYYGVMLYEGKKLPRDYAEAFKWFTKAAANGNDDAMHALGICHFMGHGAEQDSIKAAQWFRQAAELGNSEAQNNLGNCYSNGDGVPLDLEQAAHWWRKAALQHNQQAQFNVGCMALQLDNDQVEAYFWWRILGIKHPQAPNRLRQLIELMPPEILQKAERRYAAIGSEDEA